MKKYLTNTLAGILISTASNIYAQNRSIEFEKDTVQNKVQVETKRSKGELVYEQVKKLKENDSNYSKTLGDYFKTQDEKEMFSRVNWALICLDENKDKLDSKHFQYLLKNKEKFDSLYNKDLVDNEIIDSYFRNIQKRFHEDITDIPYYKEWMKKVEDSGFYRKKDILIEALLDYHWRRQNWEEYAKNAIILVDSLKVFDKPKSYHNMMFRLDNIISRFYKNMKDEKLIEKASEWSIRYNRNLIRK